MDISTVVRQLRSERDRAEGKERPAVLHASKVRGARHGYWLRLLCDWARA